MINTKLWIKKFEHTLDAKYFILLILSTLHYEGKITDAKLKGQFQALRKGTLQSRRRLYHCEINNQWYNDEYPIDIFKEVAEDKRINKVPFKKLIADIQLLENVNYNYALNIFGSNYLFKFFNMWNPEYCEDFPSYIDFYISGVHAINNSHTCYECGCNHINIDKNERENLITLNNWIHNQKKGNLAKIPRIKIEDKASSWWPF